MLGVDDNMGRMLGSNAVGGFRMQVNRGDADAAVELLTKATSEDSHEDPENPTEQNHETGTSSVPSSPVAEKSIDMALGQRQRLAGLLIVLTVSFLPLVASSILRVGGMYPDSPDALIRYKYFNALLNELTSLALLAYVIRQNRQSFSAYGLGFRGRDILHGLLLYGAAEGCYRLSFHVILSFSDSLGWHRTGPYVPSLK